MTERAIALRYAKALFDLDYANETVKQRLRELQSLISVLHDQPKLVRFLKTSQVTLELKKKALHDLLKGKCDPVFMNFLLYLIQKNRLGCLDHIATEYRLLVNDYLGIWEADIVTAVPMDSDSAAKLKKKLEREFHKDIILNQKVDPQIIGGAILFVANEMLDWSVVGRLKKLKEKLITTQT